MFRIYIHFQHTKKRFKVSVLQHTSHAVPISKNLSRLITFCMRNAKTFRTVSQWCSNDYKSNLDKNCSFNTKLDKDIFSQILHALSITNSHTRMERR